MYFPTIINERFVGFRTRTTTTSHTNSQVFVEHKISTVIENIIERSCTDRHAVKCIVLTKKYCKIKI